GSPDDNNAKFFFSGAWDVLLPYVQKGTLVNPSGKAPKSNDEWTTIGITGWKSAGAQSEMDNRLSSNYAGGKKVQAVLSPNDSLAIGIEASLKAAGYKVGVDWPLITGQDGDKANVKAILAGEQSMTVWKDTRKLGAQVFKMIQQIVKGETVEVNDTKTYNNGVKVVPSYLIEPEVVVKDQVQSKLIDSGFLKASDVGLG
ncbi:MAG: substrate-binding domain-containing protein, partial [Propionibacteriales bacterium]|nr:substrate-binding domain-containing protein [Propionibacteriales bacterium]